MTVIFPVLLIIMLNSLKSEWIKEFFRSPKQNEWAEINCDSKYLCEFHDEIKKLVNNHSRPIDLSYIDPILGWHERLNTTNEYYSVSPSIKDINIACLLLSIGVGTGKPFCLFWVRITELRLVYLVQHFHEREFFNTSQSREIEPVVIASVLQIVSVLLNCTERNTSKSLDLKTYEIVLLCFVLTLQA